MADKQHVFVGREEELAALKQAITRPEGQLVLVVGGTGFGKTALLEKLNEDLAEVERHFCLLYRLNRNDTSEAFLYRLMGDLLNVEDLTRRRLVLHAPGQVERWKTLAKLIPGVGEGIADLIPEERRPIRERFVEFLHAAAGKLEDWQRLVLVFDPDEYLDESVEADLVSLMRDLPDRTTIIFAQRLDDCLARSEGLRRCSNVCRVPDGDLKHLNRDESDDLVARRWSERIGWTKLGDPVLKALRDELWRKYKGYALPLTMALRDLPAKPASADELLDASRALPKDYEGILRKRYDEAVAVGESATRLLHGLAVLEVPAACERVAAMYVEEGCSADSLTSVSRAEEMARCLRLGSGGAVEFFHATMGECVLGQMSEEAKRDLHRRASALYAADLDRTGSDKDALDRYPFHAYHAGDVKVFLQAVDRVGKEKYRLRLLRSLERDLKWTLPECRRLAQAEPAAFERYLAATLNNLGTVLRDLGEREPARQAFEEALGMYRKLAQAEPAPFEPYLVATLNNLGTVLRDLGKRAEARKAYEEALGVCRRLAEAAFAPDVAMTLNNLGVVLSDLGERAEARKAYEEALAIRRKLAQAEPAAFEPDVAGTLSNLGTVLSDLGERELARQAYEEALGIYRRLAQAEPAAFEPYLAMTLNNLGNVLRDVGERGPAREAFEEALGIRRRLAQAEPAAFESDMAMTLNNLGTALSDLGERKLAREAFEEALGIRRRLAQAEPAAFEPHVAMTLNNLGTVLRDVGERGPAREAFEKALGIYRKLAEAEPAAFEPHVAMTLNNLGAVLSDLGEGAEARHVYDEALRILVPWMEREPRVFAERLTTVVRNAVTLLAPTGEEVDGWPTLAAAVRLLQRSRGKRVEEV